MCGGGDERAEVDCSGSVTACDAGCYAEDFAGVDQFC